MNFAGCGSIRKRRSATVMRYLAGGKYQNLRELAKENFDTNDEIAAAIWLMAWHGAAFAVAGSVGLLD